MFELRPALVLDCIIFYTRYTLESVWLCSTDSLTVHTNFLLMGYNFIYIYCMGVFYDLYFCLPETTFWQLYPCFTLWLFYYTYYHSSFIYRLYDRFRASEYNSDFLSYVTSSIWFYYSFAARFSIRFFILFFLVQLFHDLG